LEGRLAYGVLRNEPSGLGSFGAYERKARPTISHDDGLKAIGIPKMHSLHLGCVTLEEAPILREPQPSLLIRPAQSE
jgi:hypothetical protein